MAGEREDADRPGWLVLDAAAEAAQGLLGDGLLAAYAIGSLAHGGFHAAVSDVDLALLTADGIDLAAVLDDLRARTRAAAPGPLAERLSVFHSPRSAFADPPPSARFPAIDRLDLAVHGALIAGTDWPAGARPAPSHAEVAREALAFGLPRCEPTAVRALVAGFRDRPLEARSITKAVMLPVRMVFVAERGEVGGNDRGPPPDDRSACRARAARRQRAALARSRRDRSRVRRPHAARRTAPGAVGVVPRPRAAVAPERVPPRPNPVGTTECFGCVGMTGRDAAR